jgi:hypothetical protein
MFLYTLCTRRTQIISMPLHVKQFIGLADSSYGTNIPGGGVCVPANPASRLAAVLDLE